MNKKEDVYKITSIILIIDQIIKLIINNNMELYQKITVIPKFFYIYFVKNTGAAFSILENNTLFLVILSVFFILIINKYIKEEKNLDKYQILSLGLILGGIFGNLIDRIIHHGVIDYLSFDLINYEFPIFNFADTTICIGVFLMLLTTIIETIKSKKTKQ